MKLIRSSFFVQIYGDPSPEGYIPVYSLYQEGSDDSIFESYNLEEVLDYFWEHYPSRNVVKINNFYRIRCTKTK